MRVVFFGYSATGSRTYRVLRSLGADIVAVVTHRSEGDERAHSPSVEELARTDEVRVAYAPSFRTFEAPSWVRELRPDLVFSSWFRCRLGPATLRGATVAALNLHPALLPRYRGRSPINWAILRGEREAGLTLHHMVHGLDAGDIVAQRAVPIGPDDHAIDVFRRVDAEIEPLLQSIWPLILAGQIPRIPQDESQATYFGGRTPEDGRLDWTWPVRRQHDLVRATSEPFPGAFYERGEGRLRVWRTEVHKAVPPEGEAGEGTILSNGRFGVIGPDGVLGIVRATDDSGHELAPEALASWWGVRPFRESRP